MTTCVNTLSPPAPMVITVVLAETTEVLHELHQEISQQGIQEEAG